MKIRIKNAIIGENDWLEGDVRGKAIYRIRSNLSDISDVNGNSIHYPRSEALLLLLYSPQPNILGHQSKPLEIA